MRFNFFQKYFYNLIAFLVCTASMHSTLAQSQPYPFKQIPLPQDLPSILYMYKDHESFMWLGTVEGLYRYDGIHFIYYGGKDLHHGLKREPVTYVLEDHQNQLWIGARSGLYRYDPLQKDFEKFSFGDEVYPYNIYQENDSCFIMQCVKGIYILNTYSRHWDKLNTGLEDNKTFPAIRGDGDDMWIGIDRAVRRYNLTTKTWQDYPLPIPSFTHAGEKISVNNLFLDSHQQLWINTWFKGVVKLDTRTGTTTLFDTLQSNVGHKLLDIFNPSFAEDADGNIWMASSWAGLNIYHPATGMITHVPRGNDFTSGLIGREFMIMADQGKNLWVKSDLALHYLSSKSIIPELKSDPDVYIPDALFIEFPNPDLALIGTFFGLYTVDLNTKRTKCLNNAIHLPATHNPDFQTASDIQVLEHGTMWITTPQGLRKLHVNAEGKEPSITLDHFYPTRSGFWPSRLIPVNDSLMVIKGRSNTRVMATFNLKSSSLTYHEFPDSMQINQAAPYRNDSILIGIRNKGLYAYHVMDSAMRFIPWTFDEAQMFVQKPVFLDIIKLKNGILALCMENYGLILYDPEKQIFHHVDIAPVAKTNIVYSATEDDQNNLWLQTSHQLLFYNTQTESLSKINLASSFTESGPGYFINQEGEMYCTVSGGLHRIDRHQLIAKSEKPRLYLEQIKARDHALDWNTTSSLKLGYADNFITYEFIAPDYDNPHGITYWYKIPEISAQWISLGNQNSISFGHLTPGKYNLSLKASNDAGQWSDEVHAPEIRITPPFWRTWWFVLALVILFTSLIAYFVKLRRMKIESELKLRNKIARDLHDDIGSTLSGIKIYSGIASELAADNQELAPLLQQISDKSGTMMQSMSDIVWSINPVYDSLQDMMIRLKQYMSEVLESQNIEVIFSSHIDLKNTKLDLRHRKEIYLVLKEIINNVAKHAACHALIFDISKQKGEIVFFIQDDGVGIDETNIVLGNGLRNIEDRINDIGGKVSRKSRPGQGTNYKINVPVA